LAIYTLLERRTESPVIGLNRAVAVAMVEGPDAALVIVDELSATDALRQSHRLKAVRAHLLEMKGDTTAAKAEYVAAAGGSANTRERDYLIMKAAALGV
jgi:predicted RNA polymerase sigma factor